MGVKSGFRRASFYDPATGDTVQFNRLSPEGSEFAKTPVPTETVQGQVYGGHEAQLMIGGLDSDGLTQLDTWMEAGTPIQCAIEGAEGFVLWNEPQPIDFIRGVAPNARDGVNIHQIGLMGVQGDIDVYQAVNLISAGSGAFELLRDSIQEEAIFLFPVEGTIITATGTYTTGNDSVSLLIQAQDYSGSGLLTESANIPTNETGLRQEVSITLPSNTYKVAVFFDNSAVGATINDKTIRIGTNSEYVNY